MAFKEHPLTGILIPTSPRSKKEIPSPNKAEKEELAKREVRKIELVFIDIQRISPGPFTVRHSSSKRALSFKERRLWAKHLFHHLFAQPKAKGKMSKSAK